MHPPHDRRQELRREEDEEIRVILARHGVRLDTHDQLLGSLGSVAGHLTLIDSKVDDHERRFDRLEGDIAASLRRVEDQIGSLHAKLDTEIDQLTRTFIPRLEMPSLYVPRKEQEQRWQFRMQWPGALLSVAQLVVLLLLLIRTVH